MRKYLVNPWPRFDYLEVATGEHGDIHRLDRGDFDGGHPPGGHEMSFVLVSFGFV